MALTHMVMRNDVLDDENGGSVVVETLLLLLFFRIPDSDISIRLNNSQYLLYVNFYALFLDHGAASRQPLWL
jgi:hypothetical protein